ncbi:hypothetical protein [Gimesia chilikensis]
MPGLRLFFSAAFRRRS